jgi:protease-4
VKISKRWIVTGIVLTIGVLIAIGAASGLGGPHIGLIVLEDVIFDSRPHTTFLREMQDDESIRGAVLRIDSPGGAVGPSQEIFEAVRQFRATGKPLVVSMGSVAASGGYYAACGASTIFANPGTLTGSIGVVMQFSRYYKLLDKLGVAMETLKAGALKDIGTPLREMTDKERVVLQEVLDDTHEQFINHIAQSRTLEPQLVKSLADGRIFTGSQARTLGLVDTLGGLEDALAFCKSAAGLGADARVEEKREQEPLLNALLTKTSLQPLNRAAQLLLRGGILCLWDGF